MDEQANYEYTIDEDFLVFTTPKAVYDLHIGLDLWGYQNNADVVQPFVVDGLVEMATEYILGSDHNGHYLRFPVEGANCFVTICLEINGKLCKLQSEELRPADFFKLPIKNQVKTFQRLLNEKRITMEDLCNADIDLGVYKQLCINESESYEIYENVICTIARWIKKCYNSKKWGKFYDKFRGTEKMDYWLELATE